MAKTKRIVCPHCKKAHLPRQGYEFGSNLSLMCGECKKVIFPSTEEAEIGIPKAAERRYPIYHGHNVWQPENRMPFA